MNLQIGYPCLLDVKQNKTERAHFINFYDKTPEMYMEEYEPDYECDLAGKYVLSVENRCSEQSKNDFSWKYLFDVLGIYTPRVNQKAKLSHHGHISFVTITNEKDEVITILQKNDECYPQSFDEWYEENMKHTWKYTERCGEIPTKDEVIDLIKLIIRGTYQNPSLELDIKGEDIIVIQGL